ncbi:histidine phosphatase superfamily [Parachaetomium inaequale]|uniref:Phytase A n=1 Tax=Parachaetomium inaequale TaxID=2588326 RepID=A0AAN6PJB3_9PEZI|nr:histidine phosphatase superfamily [Parachaetomium inaequale]
MASLMDWFRRGRSGYAPLPENGDPNGAGNSQGHADHQARRREWTKRAVKTTAVALMLVMVGYLAVAFMRSGPRQCDTPDKGFQCGAAVSHSWGQYSPYFSVPSEMDASVPRGCEVTFAQVLSRHGARAPTFKRAVYYADLIDRIHDGAVYYSPGFDFLRTYNYTLGAEQLTQMGQQQMVNSGLKFYHRYRALARTSALFVRAGGQDRVVHSAENFTQGFHSALLADRKSTARPSFPYDMVVIPETPTTNNTLHHSLCTAFEEGPYSTIGAAAQSTYLSTFAGPLTARLNTNLPGANLTDADTIALMDLCPFETVASPGGTTLAPFCQLFSAAEWQSYDYFQSLGKWYGFGPGNPLGPTQGVGFVNELLARLTGTPVRDGTSTNRTLDGDQKTFPLGRTLYADFSHDNDMMGVLGALGVYDGVKGLDNSTRRGAEEVGGYAASWAVPFAARVYVEKMRCRQHRWKGEEEEEMVRVLVNDRVMKLRGCGADKRGMCTLGRFVESMAFARGDGRWERCFA